MSDIPQISDYMISHLFTIQYDDTASAAEKVMGSHHVRHLPVLDGKKVMGIISDRDILLARTAHKDRKFDGNVLVKDICLFEDCTVSQEDSLERVALLMSKKKLDAVVVVDGNKPIGIFTATDACRILAKFCKSSGAEKKGFWRRLIEN